VTTHPDWDRSPSWSPDGAWIVYHNGGPGDFDVWRKPAQGTWPPTRLTDGPYNYNVAPCWSPSGDEIVFASDRAGDMNLDLWVMDTIGNPLRQITSFAPVRSVSKPDWSADGSTIAFYWGSDGGADRNDIWIVDAAGGAAVQITANPAGTRDRDPSWAPDGSLIAFGSDRGGNTGIWVVEPVPGAVPALIEMSAGDDRDPAWSPDGEWIAFKSNRTGTADIWLMPSGGGTAVQVTTDPANDYEPCWSPDGTAIAFVSDRSGNPDIWIIDVPTAALEDALAAPAPSCAARLDVHPNPFNPATEISYTVRDAGPVSLYLYDVQGRLLERLIDGAFKPAGTHTLRFAPERSSGTYLLRLTAGTAVTRKIVIVE
jgi:Tol biopolymer transport system component